MERVSHKLPLLAIAAALFVFFAAVAGATAGGGSGGVGTGSGGSGGSGGNSSGGGKDTRGSKSCKSARFGSRTLSRGDCGSDVKTLNWMLRSKASSVDLAKDFKGTTASAVRSFERAKNLEVNGVVEKKTRQKLTRSLPRGNATWYGPTLYGNGVACGGTLRKHTIGVAHKTMPCGTKILVGYKGHWVRTKVIDRGPYGTHAQWDLTEETAKRLHFKSTGFGKITFAKVKRH